MKHTFVFHRRTNLTLGLALFCASSAQAQAQLGQDDPRPVVNEAQVAPETPAREGLPTIHIVGDSTLKSNAPQRGWGQELGAFFDASKVNVINHAIGGRSSRTFIREGRWDRVMAQVKAGDIVLIQFGHNDVGKYDNPAAKGRPSLHGEGDETAEVTKEDGSKETVRTFGWYMRKYGADVKAKGATAVFCSMVPHKDWKDGKIQRGERNDFVRWTANAAKATGAAFIDLNEMVALEYEKLGQEQVETFFADRRTHTTPAGAELNAKFVVAGLRALSLPMVDASLQDKGKAVEPKKEHIVATVVNEPQVQPVNAAPAPSARRPLPEPANPNLPTLFLIGDSTVRNGQGDGSNGQWGWGEPLADYLDASKINLVNRAIGGLSSRTYLTGGHWDATRSFIKPGDFVVMQFGHNDSGAINDTSRARASLRGTGNETEDIDNLLTKKHEVVHTYGWYLRNYIAQIRALGGVPVVCSPVPRKGFTDGKANRNAGTYGGWAAEVAAQEGVAFINLNEIIAKKYDALGRETVEGYFADANTHTNRVGAELNAGAVVAGLKSLRANPLGAFFSAKAAAVTAAEPTDVRSDAVGFKFHFGTERPQAGYLAVGQRTAYNKELRYGFEPGAEVKAAQKSDLPFIRNSHIVSAKPFHFSVALPEGGYRVQLVFGGGEQASSTTVKAEVRRLMVENVRTEPGQFTARSFTVNVRNAQIGTGGSVRLKPREQTSEIWNWDDKLTLEFNGENPTLSAIEITPTAIAPTLFLMGDSTVCDQPGEPYASWGQMLPRFFQTGVSVANHAQSGETLRSSLAARRLEKVLSQMKAGDYLLVQFGHNDMKERGDGIGPFTSYSDSLRLFVTEARKKGGTPVLITSMHRRTFGANAKITNSLNDYPEAVRKVAQELEVPLIDLHAMSQKFYEALGPERSKLAFAPGDGTHHNNYGAYELARCVVNGIREAKLDVAKFLAEDVPAFDPAQPDNPDTFKIPASPNPPAAKPDGS